jgi:acetyl-CoA carboxylase carboxyltransferase component
MTAIGKPIASSIETEKNSDNMKNLLRVLKAQSEQTKLGGGKSAIEKLKARGKMTARERIAKLVDPGTHVQEIGLHAAHDMYADVGGAPAAGVVIVIGKIHGRDCMIVANDATVKAGAWFPMACKKNLRAQEIAIENRIPLIYLVDSAGVFLPMQDEIFPDKEHFGRIFRNNAVISAMGIPQIAAIMGPCVAGGAYLPIMSDEAMIVKGTGSVFLAGPALVEAAIGEKVDTETLGGAVVHCEISGVTDYEMENDEECLDTIRSIISKLGHPLRVGEKRKKETKAKSKKEEPQKFTVESVFDRIAPQPPKFPQEEIYNIIPYDRTKQFSTHDFLARVVDNGSFDEYKAKYGQSIVCAYARIDGWAVGIVANQRAVARTKKGEMQVGGVIYSDSADKAARFIMNCNQQLIPLVFFQDVTGFMVGTRSEHGGIIKDGAKMVNAVANSVVPKITFIIGNSYGAGNYAMCGKAYDPRFIFAYPTASIAVMGGAQASKTLLSIKLSSLEKTGKTITAEDQKKMLDEIQQRYDSQTSPLFAAARLWVDAIVDPKETRETISHSLEIASNNNHIPEFKVGVMQT